MDLFAMDFTTIVAFIIVGFIVFTLIGHVFGRQIE